jgi:DNA-binding MarR family transcriptional regulator
MTQLIKMKVKETLPVLKLLLKDAKPYVKPRIRILMAIKKERNATRIRIAEASGVSSSAVSKWIKLYEQKGIKELLERNEKGRRSFEWPTKVREAIIARLKSGDPISYTGMYKWLQKKHQWKISISAFYKYARRDFGKMKKELKLKQLPEIKESLQELKEAYENALPKIKSRMQILLVVKERKINGISDIVRAAGSTYQIILNCLELYKKGGLTRVRQYHADINRAVISEGTHNAIKNRLQSNPNEKLADLHRWLQKNQSPQLQYATLYAHVRRHFPLNQEQV